MAAIKQDANSRAQIVLFINFTCVQLLSHTKNGPSE